MLWIMNVIITMAEWINRKVEGRYKKKNIKMYKKIIKARNESAGQMYGVRCSAVRCNLCARVFNTIHESSNRFHLKCPHCGGYDSKVLRPLADKEIKNYICKH